MITSIETALVADDDALMREFVVETLRRKKIAITAAENGLEAKRLLEEHEFDLAFVDLKMPGMDGMQLLKHIKENGYGCLPIIITAFGTVEKAVEAMRFGAYDFLMKPFSPEQVEIIINRAREWVTLKAQNTYLKEELGWVLPQGRQIIGQSQPIQKLMKDVHQVAASTSNVLLMGESGTGKELVALAIHSLSSRREGPFIRMNCAAVPETLMDSELFGHEKGSFTNAISRRVGRFELAHHGTLLLDEVSEMNLGVQAKLLRVLQEHEFERVGGSHTIKVDCRIIATTNRDLRECVNQGKFRQDLFFRLNVVPIRVPPLRERIDDISLLVKSFINRFSAFKGKKSETTRISDETLEKMTRYSWPGNVRELENLIERLCVMEEDLVLGPEKLPPEIRDSVGVPAVAVSASNGSADVSFDSNTLLSIPLVEQQTILKALKLTHGNRRKSADLLGISIRTLRNKLNRYRQEDLIPADL
jgi:two-component system response regulator AtoC